ncbi:hypothetical protein K469DRAFT_15476 [Zopfia rhizophila CBS 207.26]|uniref:Uncharacterized protein n=1 Tax=Zopfia rhizophila CBS 207.26 TaxID=1314779 RepID=A0A6A6EX86_9PEZI|nr:hypothetical protein K469DRAFT_15476 [Zopfia rhizophila CBS 207.26]
MRFRSTVQDSRHWNLEVYTLANLSILELTSSELPSLCPSRASLSFYSAPSSNPTQECSPHPFSRSTPGMFPPTAPSFTSRAAINSGLVASPRKWKTPPI